MLQNSFQPSHSPELDENIMDTPPLKYRKYLHLPYDIDYGINFHYCGPQGAIWMDVSILLTKITVYCEVVVCTVRL